MLGANWQKNPASQIVLKVALIFFALCLLLVLHRYFSFYASYDQGIFNQVFWNGTQGNFFQSSLSSALSTNVVHNGEYPDVSYHRLGQHFTPALLLWLPLYALFPSPVTLSVLQVVLVTAAGLVLYRLAREYLESNVAAWITASFYGANAIIGPTLGNFHDICQLPLFVFSLLLTMERRCWWLFWIFAALILAVREDSGISLFGVGVYLIFSRRYPIQGVIACVLSFGYMVALTNLIMPLFSDDISARFMMERFGQYVEGDEASTLEIIRGILTQPQVLLIELVTPVWGTLKYLLGQWLPFALIPAIAPASWAVAGFPLLKLLIAKGESVLAITIRYAMTVVPGLAYGSILWWSHREQEVQNRSQGKEQRTSPVWLPTFFAHPLTMNPAGNAILRPRFRRFWAVCIGLSLFFTLTSNPNRTLYFLIPDSVNPWVHISLPQQWSQAAQLRSLLSKIPPDASVAATTYIVPHVSSRRSVLRFPQYQLRDDTGDVVSVDYVIADLWQLEQYRQAFRSDRKRLNAIIEQIQQLTAAQEYGVIGFENGIILMQKNQPSDPSAFESWKLFKARL
ncbi:MAG: DUF2079 domain-containing protein [Microcoleaceae cyanobacterium]